MRASIDVPFFNAPADLRCDVGPLAGWFTQPSGVVFQMTEPARMTVAMASWAAGTAFQTTLEHFSESPRVYYIMDIRAMSDREPGVREVFMQLGREAGPRLQVLVILPPRRATPMYLAALQTASTLLVPFGTKLEIIGDLQTMLQRYPLQHAA